MQDSKAALGRQLERARSEHGAVTAVSIVRDGDMGTAVASAGLNIKLS